MPRLLKRAWCVAAMHARAVAHVAADAGVPVRVRVRACARVLTISAPQGALCAGVAACWRTSLESVAWGSLALDSALRCMVAIGEDIQARSDAMVPAAGCVISTLLALDAGRLATPAIGRTCALVCKVRQLKPACARARAPPCVERATASQWRRAREPPLHLQLYH